MVLWGTAEDSQEQGTWPFSLPSPDPLNTPATFRQLPGGPEARIWHFQCPSYFGPDLVLPTWGGSFLWAPSPSRKRCPPPLCDLGHLQVGVGPETVSQPLTLMCKQTRFSTSGLALACISPCTRGGAACWFSLELQTPASPLPGCVTQGRLLKLSEPVSSPVPWRCLGQWLPPRNTEDSTRLALELLSTVPGTVSTSGDAPG